MDATQIANLTAEDVIMAVRLGRADDQLPQLQHVVKGRQKVKARSFRPGQRFVLNDTVRPKYLAGVGGKIVKVNATRCQVEFDPGQDTGRFPRFGVSVPFSLIDPA